MVGCVKACANFEGEKISLASHHDHEITKVNVYHDRYLVATTQWSIIVADLVDKKKSFSEVRSLVSSWLLMIRLNGKLPGMRNMYLTTLVFV